MIRSTENRPWKTFDLDEAVTDDDLGNLIDHDVYLIGNYVYGYLMENLYLRSSMPRIEQAEKLPSGLFCLRVGNHGYVYLKTGKVVVWND